MAIVGSVGSGKTSLLSAILGEMNKVDGEVLVKGSKAYVAQSAWIRNATLKDNILFGKEKNDSLYYKVEQLTSATFRLRNADYAHKK